jgi:hypothetical protein
MDAQADTEIIEIVICAIAISNKENGELKLSNQFFI